MLLSIGRNLVPPNDKNFELITLHISSDECIIGVCHMLSHSFGGVISNQMDLNEINAKCEFSDFVLKKRKLEFFIVKKYESPII